MTATTKSEASKKPRVEIPVHRYSDSAFKSGEGLRSYASYRRFGTEKASGGLVQFQAVRLQPPCTDAVRKFHFHALNFQGVYILRGWIKMEFEGVGEMVMNAGDFFIQPPGSVHRILDYSDDFEDLELNIPAEFETVNV